MAKYGLFKYGQAKYGTDEPLWITSRKKTDLQSNTKYAYINYDDLNRIESRISEISTILNEKGFTHSIVTNIWQEQTSNNIISNMPIVAKTQNIIDNINVFIALTGIKLSINVPSTMAFLSIDTLNNLEQALYEIYKYSKELV